MGKATRGTPPLFEVKPSTPTRAVKLTAFKVEHGILTHRAGHMKGPGEHPWMALLPFDEDKGKDLWDIMGRSCRLYEEAGWLATGTGELSAVRALCLKRGIQCPL